jgi:hypothetical protein
VVGLLFLLLQDAPKPVHETAYLKAKQYCLANYARWGMPVKVCVGFLLLADGGHPQELEACIQSAMRAPQMIRTPNQGWSNWYLGFGGIFLAQAYRMRPRDDLRAALEAIAQKAAELQEPTGGWFSCKSKDGSPKYCAKDHGLLTSMLYSTFLIMRSHKMQVPERLLESTEKYIDAQCSPREGIMYGTGNSWGDVSGSRGSAAMIGLDAVGRRDHKVFSTYAQLMPRCHKNLRKAHHIGGGHFTFVILGCRLLGPDHYGKLVETWMETLVKEQRDDGGFFLGDDGASGGEKGGDCFGSDGASSAALALFILLRNHPDRLKPPRPSSKQSGAPGKSPFSQKR